MRTVDVMLNLKMQLRGWRDQVIFTFYLYISRLFLGEFILVNMWSLVNRSNTSCT